ncbi:MULTISPECIES: 23S rRNA (adenine(2030)-N(6))-methyltransferase RlmJ [unclassified Acidiphilium]|uniref:23S rRNA (adenine(2030)-N(6))-methyltransferase RlmJ n=1 Tax=unclassified Acidiphilium TaxID=2617493 RepID=UPI000BD9F4C6|nr:MULTISPECIES: 23S rRNA (adenine(2030)-N(6))-methyltransferase RlmJ [unclassified Acidiphilium]OYV56705.1 MAG: 23S rRNA (adenine(2030)-N(6))-methyltransferase RlmJ [Acidiphilium sp. 20-67-58]OYV86990.1 MAG: 23S rRNA (adenine(2030)-N(6))-methyltransferase RlmJ [Acidiphilium sp. 21-68-69]HQT60850.1 23S rRNA (adenine(2030)-N(6))-methyltransferase RlmJ [Acidiphilium sp.]
MNYRHAYHAGNAADCLKHALLVLLLRALTRKAKPLFVLDTHAGLGAYDLAGPEAGRTREWEGGIGRLRAASPTALADYLALVPPGLAYPGSPAIARALLRPGDRLALCELHPEDAAALKRRFRGDPLAQVHARDGYEAVSALLPPAERRALVLIDPPFERADEFAVLARTLDAGRRKFPSGVFAAWYPVKHRAPVRDFMADITARGIPDVIACEMLLRPAIDPARLNGSGLLVINPPYGFEAAAAPVLEALCAALGEEEASTAIIRLAGEDAG